MRAERRFGLPLVRLVLVCVGLAVAGPVSAQPRLADLMIRRLEEITDAKTARPIPPDAPPIVKLTVERYNVCLEELRLMIAEYHQGIRRVDAVYLAAENLLQAELAAAPTPEDRIKILDRAIASVTWYEGQLDAAVRQGAASRSDLLLARSRRLSMQIEQLNLREALEKQAKEKRAAQNQGKGTDGKGMK